MATVPRWKALFDDLEGQAEALDRAEHHAEVRDRVRREVALVRWADRVATAEGERLQLLVHGGGTVVGLLLSSGPDWLLLEDDAGSELLVPDAAVLAVSGLGPWSRAAAQEGEVARRLDLRWALRGLARDRATVVLVLRDGSRLTGTVERVGADHLDLTEHAAGDPPRVGALQARRLLPLDALALLRRR